MKFNWEKQSYRRYSARLAGLPLEVVRVGVAPFHGWKAGNVFGREFHHDNPITSFLQAQARAEDLAAQYATELFRAYGKAGAK